MSELRLRRCLLVGIVVVLVALPLGMCAQQQQQYRVAACDWMMLKRQKLGEFQLAKDINADGVEVDMGPAYHWATVALKMSSQSLSMISSQMEPSTASSDWVASKSA